MSPLGHADAETGAPRSPGFHALVVARRRLVAPLAGLAIASLLAFAAVAGWAPGAFTASISGSVTVGIVVALAQIALVWGAGLLYARISNSTLDPLRGRILAEYAGETPCERPPFSVSAERELTGGAS